MARPFVDTRQAGPLVQRRQLHAQDHPQIVNVVGQIVVHCEIEISTDRVETIVAETLAARVLEKEHQIYPMVAQWFVEGRLRLVDGGAELDGKLVPVGGVSFDS